VAAFFHQRPDQGRPDEPAAARDEPVHEDRVRERVPSEFSIPECIPILGKRFTPRIP
jgi:hypothetical protein